MPFAGLVRPSLRWHVKVAHVFEQTAAAASFTRCSFNHSSNSRFCNRLYSSSSTTKSSLHHLRERSQKQRVLVFQSTSTNPYHNLAIEHFLLTNSDTDSRILLFYTNRPCVVIGRNQNPWTECNLKLLQDGINGSPIDLVRRRSGGGAVFHDEGNLNFSVIVPNDKDFNRRKHSEMVVRALNELRMVSAEYDGPENIWVNQRHDITMATMHNKGRSEFKVSGSAFKLTRGRALHHGTLLHSSPNLNNISPFLRAIGKDWIKAKGVESVRSPVMNLYNVQSDKERDILRSQIMEQIVNQFLQTYDADVKPEIVGDSDCQYKVNADIAEGVKELQTDEWRFDQTPRFEFSSQVISGKQVTFAVKNGLIEEARLGHVHMPIDQRPTLELQQHQKIHEIRDWCDILDPDTVDSEQIATIAQVFPNIQKLLCTASPDAHLDRPFVEHDKAGIIRRSRDGSVEKEFGMNTVEGTKK